MRGLSVPLSLSLSLNTAPNCLPPPFLSQYLLISSILSPISFFFSLYLFSNSLLLLIFDISYRLLSLSPQFFSSFFNVRRTPLSLSSFAYLSYRSLSLFFTPCLVVTSFSSFFHLFRSISVFSFLSFPKSFPPLSSSSVSLSLSIYFPSLSFSQTNTEHVCERRTSTISS